MFSWGRSGQKEYWIWIGVIVLAMAVITIILPNDSGLSRIFGIAWIIAWIRRLHDVGKSGWVVLGPMALQFALVLVPIFALGGNFARALTGDEAALSDEATPNALYAALVIGTVLLIQIGFSVWLGIKPGDSGPNKYGPSPIPQPAGQADAFD